MLVLGAGFDTLCLRLAPRYPGARFVEVDSPATSAAKARGVGERGGAVNMTLIAADLGEEQLSGLLAPDERWDASKPSVVVAEGLLQYLRDDDVRGLLCEAAKCVPIASRLVLTHLIPDERVVLRGILRLTGEPFQSAVRSEDLPGYLDGTGWKVVSEVDTDERHGIERYAVAELG